MASLISRLYDFLAGTKIRSSHVDEEFNQLISAHNNLVSDITTVQAQNTTSAAHEANVANPHSVTKTQVGLGNVDNTSDLNKPISTLTQTALNGKVDKVTGKSLIDDTDITKLAGIASGAEVNVQANWTQTNNSADDYIKNKPTLGTAAALNTGTGAGNIPVLDSSGKLVFAVIPSIAISSTVVVANKSDLITQSWAQVGDVGVVTSERKSYILTDSSYQFYTSWQELYTPTDLVISVCGKVGAVSLSADDVGALDVLDIIDNLTTPSIDKALSANQGKILKDFLGVFTTLDAYFVGDSRSNVVAALNQLIGTIGTDSFDTAFGAISNTVAALNYLINNKVDSSTVKAIRYLNGNFEYTTDNINWSNLTGAQGPQGKGYNPRGAWVSGGTYTNDVDSMDVVYYEGCSYYCILTVTDTTPPSSDPTHWGLLTYGSVSSGYIKTDNRGFYLDNGVTRPMLGMNAMDLSYPSSTSGALGDMSFAEGFETTADGDYSHTEGKQTAANDDVSHAEGMLTVATGMYSHSESYDTVADGDASHAEGFQTSAGAYIKIPMPLAVGVFAPSGATSKDVTVQGDYSAYPTSESLIVSLLNPSTGDTYLTRHGILYFNYIIADRVTVIATDTDYPAGCVPISIFIRQVVVDEDNNMCQHAEGITTVAFGSGAHAEGIDTVALGEDAHAEGYGSMAVSFDAHAEGHNTIAGQVDYFYSIQDFDNTNKTITVADASNLTDGMELIISGDDTTKPHRVVISLVDHNTQIVTLNTVETIDSSWSYAVVPSSGSDCGAHAEGSLTMATGYASHAEGYFSLAKGNYAHAEGDTTIASGNQAHTEGTGTIASGSDSHAEGLNTLASGTQCHAEGSYSEARGNHSHAEGYGTLASGTDSHTEGYVTTAAGSAAHSEGYDSHAPGLYAHAEGYKNFSVTTNAHTEGSGNLAVNGTAYNITAFNNTSKTITVESLGNLIVGDIVCIFDTAGGHAIDIPISAINGLVLTLNTTKTLLSSWKYAIKKNTTLYPTHAEGMKNLSSGSYSHAEGYGSWAIGGSSHAEGGYSAALGSMSHAECESIASGTASHAEGYGTASAEGAHAEGSGTASGFESHAEGNLTTASGDNSHVSGKGTIAQGYNQTVIGKYNVAQGTADSLVATDKALIVGNGTTVSARADAMSLTWAGDLELAGTMRARAAIQSSDFLNNNAVQGPFLGAAVSSGTIASYNVNNDYVKHPGAFAISSTSSANTGYRFMTAVDALIVGPNDEFEAIFYAVGGANSVIRMGFLDANTVTAVADGVYAEINSVTLTGKARSNSVETVSGTTATLTANTWYRLKILMNADASAATFTLYADDSDTVVWTQTISSNIPNASPRYTGAGIIAYNTGTAAVQVVIIDYMHFIIKGSRKV